MARHAIGQRRPDTESKRPPAAGVYAGDQKPLGAPSSEQCKPVADARVAAGQHHDTVGVAIKLDLLVRQLPNEITEAADKQNRGNDNELDADRTEPAPSHRLSKARHSSAPSPKSWPRK